jgi:HK97 family phage portal protein
MSLLTRLFGGRKRSADDDALWTGGGFLALANSEIEINQVTAQTATTVLAAVTMLCEDFAKLTPTIYRLNRDGSGAVAEDQELYPLLYQPDEWQTYFEWAEMIQLSLVLRGNANSVKIRDRRTLVDKLVPVNADWVAIWEAPDGVIFYRVAPNGLHMMAELHGPPFLSRSQDMLHVRGFSLNGLAGASRISLAKEAIGLALGYERPAAQYMS